MTRGICNWNKFPRIDLKNRKDEENKGANKNLTEQQRVKGLEGNLMRWDVGIVWSHFPPKWVHRLVSGKRSPVLVPWNSQEEY